MAVLPEILVSRETQTRLELLVEEVLLWSRRVNLVGGAEPPSIWDRHVLDSLQLAPLLGADPGTLVDMGSGAGFPGLVLAIAMDRHVHLVEADRRKAAFLREAARVTRAPVTVHPVRIEAAEIPTPAVIMARALAPLSALLCYAEKLAGPKTSCLFPKGIGLRQELAAAEKQWAMKYALHPSTTNPEAAILEITEFARASR